MKWLALGLTLILVMPAAGGQGGGVVTNEAPVVRGLANNGTTLHFGTIDVIRGDVLDTNGARDIQTVHVDLTGDLTDSATATVDSAAFARRHDPGGPDLRVWDPVPGDGRVSFALAVATPVVDAQYTWHVWGADEAGAGPVRTRAVTVLNGTPQASADIYVVSPDSPFSVERESGILANDRLRLATPPTVEIGNITGNGTLNVSADGGLTFVPEPGHVGNVTFTYQTVQAGLRSAPVTVTLTQDSPEVFHTSDCSILGIAISRNVGSIRFDAGDDTGCLTLVKTHPGHGAETPIPLEMGGIARTTVTGQKEVQIGELPLRLQRVDAADKPVVDLRFANRTIIRNSTEAWDGSFIMPTFENVSPSAVQGGERGVIQVRIGAPARLGLDQPAQLRFAGGAGDRVRVTHDDITWEEVTHPCDGPGNATIEDTLITADSALDDCKVDDGEDLVVWTTHFSAYALVASVAATSGGGGWQPRNAPDPPQQPDVVDGEPIDPDNETIASTSEPDNAEPIPVPRTGGPHWLVWLLVASPGLLLFQPRVRQEAGNRLIAAKEWSKAVAKQARSLASSWAARLRDRL